MKKRLVSTLFVAALLIASTAHAADTGIVGFDIQRFRPTFDRSGILTVYGSRTLTHLRPTFAIDADYAQSLFAIRAAGGGSTQLIKKMLTADVTAGIGFFDRIDIGFDVPVHAYVSEMYTVNASTITTVGLGDIRFALKGRALADKGNLPGIAILGFVDAPTGNDKKFMGNKGISGGAKIIVDKAFLGLRDTYITANVGYSLLPDQTIGGRKFGDELTFGLGAMVPVYKGLEVMAEANGSIVMRDIDRRTSPLIVMGGLSYRLPMGLSFRAAGGASVLNAAGGPKFTVTAGIAFDLGKSFDADRTRREADEG